MKTIAEINALSLVALMAFLTANKVTMPETATEAEMRKEALRFASDKKANERTNVIPYAPANASATANLVVAEIETDNAVIRHFTPKGKSGNLYDTFVIFDGAKKTSIIGGGAEMRSTFEAFGKLLHDGTDESTLLSGTIKSKGVDYAPINAICVEKGWRFDKGIVTIPQGGHK